MHLWKSMGCGSNQNQQRFSSFTYEVCTEARPAVYLAFRPRTAGYSGYDVWKEKKLYGKVNMGVVRTTYTIDEKGMAEKVMTKVKPDINAAEILDYLFGEK